MLFRYVELNFEITLKEVQVVTSVVREWRNGAGNGYFNDVHGDSLYKQMSLQGCGALSSNAILLEQALLRWWRGCAHSSACPRPTLWPGAPQAYGQPYHH